MKHVIFYSWQSDLPNGTNRSLIENSLEIAVENLKSDDELTVEPVLDRDTAGVAGSPDIAQTIFSKIQNATAFVCDVSIINHQALGRQMPNPNVLIELGYALKALGPNKVVMVMNTQFAKPESLPFDLKQKRVVTYETGKAGESNASVKKELAQKLTTAIKVVLVEAHREFENRLPETTFADKAVAAINSRRTDQARTVESFMKSLAEELKKLDPHDVAGEADENLVQALDRSVPLVDSCYSVVDAISAMDSEEAARAFYKGFEYIVTLCYLPERFSGSYNVTDFDFFKFIVNELFIGFVAFLMKDERWKIFDNIANQTLYVKNAGTNTLLNFCKLWDYSVLLNQVRKRRLGTRRISIHADMLKMRYESEPLSRRLTWSQFVAADLLLFFRGYIYTKKDSGTYWWPHTAVYLESNTPRYLIETETLGGAELLTKILGLKDTAELRHHLDEALKFLFTGLRQQGSFVSMYGFNLSKIPVP
jgi:hypothetical protein